MRTVSLLLTAGVGIGLAFSSGSSSELTIGGSRYCIPDSYVVNSSISMPSAGGHGFDEDSSEGYVLFDIPGEEVDRAAPGFIHFAAAKAMGFDISYVREPYQVLPVSVRDAEDLSGLVKTINSENGSYQPLTVVADERAGLARLIQHRPAGPEGYASWIFLHTSSAGALDFQGNDWYWGSCDTFDDRSPTNYDCMRELRANGLLIMYPLRGENIQHYQAIDGLILGKLNEWQCPH